MLLPRIDKPGRIAAYEIMINTPSIAALIRDNKTFRVNSDIQTGAKYGMVTLDGFLMENISTNLISAGSITKPAHDTVIQKLAEWEAAQAELAANAQPPEAE